MPLKYPSGEEVRRGDRVLYHQEQGEVEFVADPLVNDADTQWYVQEYGEGVMLSVPEHFGLVFVHGTEDNGDLDFVSRRQESGGPVIGGKEQP